MSDSFNRLRAALADRYRVARELGAGGMAHVYLAEDLKHHRQVAVKVLRPELAAILGGDRFLQEIEVTANLQHPNILPLYDSGEADSFLYYVMPFVEGESLRDRLNRERQLPVDETISIGRSVASALQYAHEHDIIHRDIKPENILLQSGQALVADFGIALAVRQAGGTRLTETGLSLGTPFYMSPEQASADRELDRRSDIYSLAATMYEALAGEPPFTAPSTQAIVAKIMTESPPLVSESRTSVPAHVGLAIQQALAKLPADRFHSAAEFADALHNPAWSGSVTATVPGGVTATPASKGRWWWPWAASGAALLVAGAAVVTRPPAVDPEPVEFIVDVDQRLEHMFALSRDGRRLAVAKVGGGLWVRHLNSAELVPVADTAEGGVGQPAFSPDGEWIAFFSAEGPELRRVPTTGGTPVVITPTPFLMFGQSWGPSDTLVWGRGFTGLWAVPVEGGPPVQLTEPDTARGELAHMYPQHLPGRKLLFSTYRVPFERAAVELLDLETKARTVLFQGGAHAQFLPPDRIVYARGETLWAVPVDVGAGRVTGPARPVMEGVSYNATNAQSGFRISESGTLAFLDAAVWSRKAELTWVDGTGAEEPLPIPPGDYSTPAISPDGRYVALVRVEAGEPDIWVYGLGRDDPPTRVTRNEGLVLGPIWMDDGSLVYSRERLQLELVRRDWQSGGNAEVVARPEGPLARKDLYAYSVAPDGWLLAGAQSETWDVWTLPLAAGGEPRPYRVTEYHERFATLSPDGRWVAYTSNETGPPRLWIDPYPASDGARRRQVSRGRALAPKWGPDGTLYYRGQTNVMSVRVDLATGQASRPVERFDGPYLGVGNYAVDPRRDRLLMIKTEDDGATRRQVVVVLNWRAMLLERAGEN